MKSTKTQIERLDFQGVLPASFEKNLTIIRADQQVSTFPYRPICDLFWRWQYPSSLC